MAQDLEEAQKVRAAINGALATIEYILARGDQTYFKLPEAQRMEELAPALVAMIIEQSRTRAAQSVSGRMGVLNYNVVTLTDLQDEIKRWADGVFPDRTAHGALCKLMLEEIPEFALDTKSEDEYADLVILILDIATLNGINVAAAVERKMEKNRRRTWEVNIRTGIMHHTNEENESE